MQMVEGLIPNWETKIPHATWHARKANINIYIYIYIYIYPHVPHITMLCFIVLHRYCRFYTVKVCGNAASGKPMGVIFFNNICLLHISVPHFGNAHNVLKPPPAKKITTCESLRWQAFLAIKHFRLRYAHRNFRHNTIAQLIHYGIV